MASAIDTTARSLRSYLCEPMPALESRSDTVLHIKGSKIRLTPSSEGVHSLTYPLSSLPKMRLFFYHTYFNMKAGISNITQTLIPSSSYTVEVFLPVSVSFTRCRSLFPLEPANHPGNRDTWKTWLGNKQA